MNPLLDVALRSLAVYVFLIVAIRLFGKKELAQLSVVDLVFILLISNAVQNAMVGPNVSLLSGIVAASSLFLVNFLLKKALQRFKNFGKLIQGEPLMLIYKGVVNQHNLQASQLTIAELEAAVREHGVKRIEDVDLATLEVDGNISILSDDFRRQTTRRRKAHQLLRRDES